MNKEGESLQAMRALVCNNKYKPLDPPAPPAPSKGKVTRKGDKAGEPVRRVQAGQGGLALSARGVDARRRVPLRQLASWSWPSPPTRACSTSRTRPTTTRRSTSSPGRTTAPTTIPRRSSASTSWSSSPTRRRRSRAARARTCAPSRCSTSASASPRRTGTATRSTTPRAGLERAEKFYHGRENEPHVREIFAKLGDIYFDETEYFRARSRSTSARCPSGPITRTTRSCRTASSWPSSASATSRNALKERELLARNYTQGHRVVQAQPRQREGHPDGAGSAPSWRWCRRRSTTTRRPRI